MIIKTRFSKTVLLILISLFVLNKDALSQVTEDEVSQNKKYHYILHNIKDIESKKLYITALSKLTLDKYRLIKKRRIIEFDTDVTIELLSAEELFQKYKKPISPLNLKKETSLIFYIKPYNATIVVK